MAWREALPKKNNSAFIKTIAFTIRLPLPPLAPVPPRPPTRLTFTGAVTRCTQAHPQHSHSTRIRDSRSPSRRGETGRTTTISTTTRVAVDARFCSRWRKGKNKTARRLTRDEEALSHWRYVDSQRDTRRAVLRALAFDVFAAKAASSHLWVEFVVFLHAHLAHARQQGSKDGKRNTADALKLGTFALLISRSLSHSLFLHAHTQTRARTDACVHTRIECAQPRAGAPSKSSIHVAGSVPSGVEGRSARGSYSNTGHGHAKGGEMARSTKLLDGRTSLRYMSLPASSRMCHGGRSSVCLNCPRLMTTARRARRRACFPVV